MRERIILLVLVKSTISTLSLPEAAKRDWVGNRGCRLPFYLWNTRITFKQRIDKTDFSRPSQMNRLQVEIDEENGTQTELYEKRRRAKDRKQKAVIESLLVSESLFPHE